MVNPVAQAHRGLGTTLFSLLNPIPFGFFVGALIFDILYLNTAEVMWGKAAAWLITFGLLIAIIPRLINLFAVWRRNGASIFFICLFLHIGRGLYYSSFLYQET